MKRTAGGDRDRGAAAIIVAILVTGFMLGLGAIVTDVGSWYSERAQLQNGADAGALAVAQTCAAGKCDLAVATANQYAEGSSNNNGKLNTSAAVTSGFPCGNSPGSSTPLPACPAGTEDGTYCPLPPQSGTPYVDVHDNTSQTVAPILGSLLDKNDTGKTILACAQAQWGPPTTLGNGDALTMSACEWLKDTANGKEFGAVPSFNNDSTPNYAYQQNVPKGLPSYLDTITDRRADTTGDYTDSKGLNFYLDNNITDPHATPRTYAYPNEVPPIPPPGVPAHIAGSETVLTTIGFGNNCKEGNSGGTAPGQFGWLSNSSCSVIISGSTYGGAPGASSAPCLQAFQESRSTGTPIFLPVYNGVTPGTNGNGAQYILYGFAAFVVTGWDMTNANAGNWSAMKVASSLVTTADNSVPAMNANYCTKKLVGSANAQCIYGFFTQALIKASELPGGGGSGGGGNNLGATAPFLTG